MKYIILSARTTADLMNKVNEMVAHGYSPLGGLTYSGPGYSEYHQAMILAA